MAFEERRDLLVSCYNHLEIDPVRKPGLFSKGDLTQTEDIADLGGFLAALDAYKARLYTEDSELVSSGYEGFATLRDGYAHYLGDIGVEVKYANVITDCELLDQGRTIVNSCYISADSYMSPPNRNYFFYNNEQSFKDQFYGGGTLAVYTILNKAFSNKIYPDYEKVAY